MADWKLPEDFEPIVAGHHAPREPDAPWGMAELIHVSFRMADAAGFAAFPAPRLAHSPSLYRRFAPANVGCSIPTSRH